MVASKQVKSFHFLNLALVKMEQSKLNSFLIVYKKAKLRSKNFKIKKQKKNLSGNPLTPFCCDALTITNTLQFNSKMDLFLVNPGLNHIVDLISSHLTPKSLGQCRLVCKPWRDLIDNHRTWLSFQLDHIQNQDKSFIDDEKE